MSSIPSATLALARAAEPLTFHIVYTAGTVRLLSPFVASLLEHSPFRYRLVSNGCPREEQDLLAGLAATSPRLDLHVLPGEAVRLHDEVLNDLFVQGGDPYFAFMDSDIFAVAPFGATVTRALAEGPTFFACAQPWAGAGERAAVPGGGVEGRHLWREGRPLGTTFFAVYEREAVEQIRATYGLRFTKGPWAQLPSAAQRRLEAAGLRHPRYDTAKALNLLLALDGAPVHYDPLPALVHVGGVSVRSEWSLAAQTSPSTRTSPSARRRGRHVGQWVRAASRAGRAVVHRIRRRPAAPPAPGPPPFRDRRALAWSYFGAVIPALQAGRPVPPVPDVDDPLAQREIQRVADALVAFYAERSAARPCAARGPYSRGVVRSAAATVRSQSIAPAVS